MKDNWKSVKSLTAFLIRSYSFSVKILPNGLSIAVLLDIFSTLDSFYMRNIFP